MPKKNVTYMILLRENKRQCLGEDLRYIIKDTKCTTVCSFMGSPLQSSGRERCRRSGTPRTDCRRLPVGATARLSPSRSRQRRRRTLRLILKIFYRKYNFAPQSSSKNFAYTQ